MTDNSTTLTFQQLIQEGYLWPSAEYDRQLAELRQVIGQQIFLVLLNFSDINLAVTLENKPVRLLEVIDFPAADPSRRLYPHMLILDDGRGINLGHVARLSIKQAFAPDSEQVIFQQNRLLKKLLFQERRLSEQSIRRTSRMQLARILGKTDNKRIG
ncbi:MAG: hypothetical protein PVG50_03255 [Thiohalophilus sp.]|jgi:hypothetical protein